MSFQPAVRIDALPEVGAIAVDLEGRRVAVVRDEDGDIHAVDDTCTHANVSLAEGEVDGCTLECWLHGSRFDLRTGKPTSLPAIRPIAVYPVQLEAGTVLVDLDHPLDPNAAGPTPGPTSHELTAVKEH
jgi:3-phenylpropionate/trans-cinnamate dioxygenase ferredoxin subunit